MPASKKTKAREGESFMSACMRCLLEGVEGSEVIRDMRAKYKTVASCSFTSCVSRVRRMYLMHEGDENKHHLYKKSLGAFLRIAHLKGVKKSCQEKADSFDKLSFHLKYKMARMHARRQFCWGDERVDEMFKAIKFLPTTMDSFKVESRDLEECQKHAKAAKLEKHMNAVIINDGQAVLDRARSIIECCAHEEFCVAGRTMRIVRDEPGVARVRLFGVDGTLLLERLMRQKQRWSEKDRALPVISHTGAKLLLAKTYTTPNVVVKWDGDTYLMSNLAERFSISELAASLLLACGRRMAELLNGRSKFTAVRSFDRCVRFSGQLKKPLGPGEAYVIPLLIPAAIFLRAHGALRMRQGDVSALNNDQISNRYHGGLSRLMPQLFPEVGNVHNLRGVYIAIAFQMFEFGTKSFTAAIMQTLGHESMDVTLSYSHIVVRNINVSRKHKLPIE